MYRWENDITIEGLYRIEVDDYIAFTIEWEKFREEAHIVEGSMLMMIAEARTDYIMP